MKYNSTIEYLYGLQKYGMKFGLDNIRELTARLGNPQESFRSIHIAGTNGKGSTAAMIESMLRTGGASTGLFTSPHLISFTERIRINGVEITEQDVVELTNQVRQAAEEAGDFSPTFFEVVTAMAFLQFRRMKVDWAVVEVGMGGRLDATNIIRPEFSVITPVGCDHREFLGSTLREIAGEKAGIIRGNTPVVTAAQEPDVMDVIEKRASASGSALYRGNIDFSCMVKAEGPDGISFDYSGKNRCEDIRLPLSGRYQAVNASLAAFTVELLEESFPQLRCDIRRGLASLSWPGRLEIIRTNPPVLIDGAHNPDASRAVSGCLENLLKSRYRRIILIAGIMKDKDMAGILKPLLPVASEIIFTSPAYGRAASPELLSSLAGALGYHSRQAPSVPDALAMAEGLYMPGDIIVVTGSFYTTGEAKETLVHKGVLASLRE